MVVKKEKINKYVEASKCFGYGYDENVKECKICELTHRCCQQSIALKKRSEENKEREKLGKPPKIDFSDVDVSYITLNDKAICGDAVVQYFDEDVEVIDFDEVKKNRLKEVKTPKSKRKSPSKTKQKSYSKDMPDYKEMSVEDIKKHLTGKGVDLSEFAKYKDAKVLRMRLVMKLKSLYEI